MSTFWLILEFVLANILFIVVSSTLIGSSVRGFIQPKVTSNTGSHMIEFNQLSRSSGNRYSIIAICVAIILLILTYLKLNVFIFVAIILSMISRIKDLLTEISTGIKTSMKSPLRPMDILLGILFWLSIVLFNYGLYKFLIVDK